MAYLNDLATFIDIVRAGSLAAAARKLGVPKSTVGRRLDRLEDLVGVQLLHRGGRTLVLSHDAQTLYDRSAAAMDTLQQSLDWAVKESEEPRGLVRITAATDAGPILIKALVEFGNIYPQIIIEVDLTERFVDLVQEGFDLALRAGMPSRSGSHLQLITRRLATSALKLAATPELAAQLRDVAQLRDTPFVLFRGSDRQQTLQLVDSHRQNAMTEIVVTGSSIVHDFTSMAAFVAGGRGVGLMPDMHLSKGIAAGLLAPVFPQLSQVGGAVSLVYSCRKLPRRVQLLLDFLSDRLRLQE